MDRTNYPGQTDQQWTFHEGDEVYGAEGDKAGKVIAVYPRYILVEKGFFFPHDYYIPTSAIAQSGDRQIFLNVSKDEALTQRWEEQPVDLEGAATTATGTAGAGVGTATADYDRTATDAGAFGTRDAATQGQAMRVPVHEEELTATTRPVERGQVEVTKDVTTQEQALDVPVTEEHVRVEQRVVDRDVPATDEVFDEGTIAVPVRGEEVDVQKQVRQTGEVEITKEPVQRTERVADTVRKEQVHVDKSGDLEEEETDSDYPPDTRRDWEETNPANQRP